MKGKDNNRKFNDEIEGIKGREQRNYDYNWLPERNVVTGFTFKGFLILIGLIAIINIIKHLFF